MRRARSVWFVLRDRPLADTRRGPTFSGIIAPFVSYTLSTGGNRSPEASVHNKNADIYGVGRSDPRYRCLIRRYQKLGAQAAHLKADARLQDVADDLRTLAREGLSLNAMAKRLNDLDVKTSRGFAWTATAVRPAMLRLKT